MKRIPKDDVDQKVIKQIVLGEYSYAVNALWEKKEVKEHILKKFSKDISTECDGLCSLTNPSMLRISSSEALKCFDEKSHVQEIRERAPVLAAMVEAASVTKTKSKYKHDKSQNIGVDVQCAQSMAVSTLLRSRCLAMSTQAYRVALLLWNSGAKKQVSFSVSTSACLASFLQDCGGFYTVWYTICVSYYDYYPMCHSLFHARKKPRSYKH